MLDSNLPTYFFRAAIDKTNRYDYSLLFTQFGSDPECRYTLRHPDPSVPLAKNCYAVALLDPYVPDVVFGEILLKPKWSQPTLSAQEIRQSSGVPPPPQPVIPEDFTVQLYNPDQQVTITEKPASWAGAPTYLFSLPQYTFRTPSASALDRGTSDPAADATTPQIKFIWKREKLNNNLTCFMTGKSTDTNQKKKGGKEPDIAIAVFQNYRDLTIYESNLHRVELEDYKGLEVVLLLSAATIRDVYCGQRKDAFNVGEAARKNSAGGGILGRRKSIPMLAAPQGAPLQPNHSAPPAPSRPVPGPPVLGPQAASNLRRQSVPSGIRPPPPDPMSQWEIDAQAARLRQETVAERRAAEARRREQEKADAAEAKRLQKQMDAETKAQRKQQAEIDKETARLRKQYGDQSNLLPLPPRPSQQHRQSTPAFGYGQPAPLTRPSSHGHSQSAQLRPSNRPSRPSVEPSPYLQPSPYGNLAASVSSFFHGPGTQPTPAPRPKPKKSMLGLRSHSETVPANTLHKKKSSLF